MKILVIGNDPKLFDQHAEVFERIRGYAKVFDAFHVVTYTPTGFHEASFDQKLFLHPTNSTRRLFFLFGAVRLGRKLVKKEHLNLIDAQDAGESGLAAFLVSLTTGVPFRIQLHTDMFSPWYRSSTSRLLLARFLLNRASCIRVVSERIRRSLAQRHIGVKKNITVLPIFTDVSRFLAEPSEHGLQLRFSKYEPRMVAVGRFMEKEKNFLLLIEAMREVIKKLPHAVLVLVGEGPDGKLYESRIRAYGLEKNVLLEQWRDDLPAFLKSFDMLLLSSQYEGWGRVVVEAMAAGLPVIMTDVGLAGEIVVDGENGRVIPVGDTQKFIQAIQELAHDQQKRTTLGQNAQKTVIAKLPKSFEEYVQVYKNALEICH